MSVIFKTVKRPSDPRVENSPKRYYPQLITLGRSVDLKFIAQKIQDRSSLSVGDIKSTIQNFVEKLKEQLLEGKAVKSSNMPKQKAPKNKRTSLLKAWIVCVSIFRLIKN